MYTLICEEFHDKMRYTSNLKKIYPCNSFPDITFTFLEKNFLSIPVDEEKLNFVEKHIKTF